MCLEVLREGVRAMARWQVRLADSAYEDVINGKIEKAEAWAATEAETTPNFGGYWDTLHSESGKTGPHEWNFWVGYVATGNREAEQLTPQWDFSRLDDRHVPSVRVECNSLSYADETFLRFADDLKADSESGALVVESTGIPLACFLRKPSLKEKRVLGRYVRPTIIVGRETDGHEVLAQISASTPFRYG